MVHVVSVMLLALCALERSLAACPESWGGIRNHWEWEGTCYYYGREHVSWFEAHDRCVEIGGILAEPNTTGKLESISFWKSQIGLWPGYWLGGSDRQTEGEWIWSTSLTPIATSLWFTGRPASWEEDDDCVALYSGSIIDSQCTRENQYLCETSAIPS